MPSAGRAGLFARKPVAELRETAAETPLRRGVFLMTYLSGSTWLRSGIWMALGLAVYGLYGHRRSRLRDSAA